MPKSTAPPFQVSICESCWEGTNWGNPVEFEALLDAQRYAWQKGVVWLHRLKDVDDEKQGLVCGDAELVKGLPRSLIQLGPAVRQPRLSIEHNAALEVALIALEDGLDTVANVIVEGFQSVALAIRDQGRPL